jgi:hypothetical protein
MIIELSPQVFTKLQTIGVTWHKEFSGFGFCTRESNGADVAIKVYDFVLLDLGSEAFTQIDPQEVIKATERDDRDNLRVWVHAHPVGNGVPGPHNWSGTDENTIQTAPLGGLPEMVGWSVSIVRTPAGWVGRVDNHISRKTIHCEVFPETRSIYAEVDALREKKFPVYTWQPRYDDWGSTYPQEITVPIHGEFHNILSVEGHTFDDECPICKGECIYYLVSAKEEEEAEQLNLFNKYSTAAELNRALRGENTSTPNLLQRIKGLWR